jgi:PrcB C-terminal
MWQRKWSACVLLLALLTGGASAGSCSAQRRADTQRATPPPKPAVPSPTPRAGETPVQTDDTLTELAAGAYGTLRQPFVFVARDAETYAALRTLVASLPAQSADFFKAHAVVAAFLGQRNTGGYSVEIRRPGRAQLSITEHAPPKDAMVTMALTAPFRIVALPLEIDDALNLTLDATWQKNVRPYKITEGELVVFGGFAGIRNRSQLTGTLGVMRAGEWATLLCDVRSVGGERERRMQDAATGRVEAGGRITIKRLDAFALSGATESPLRADGAFTDGEQNLTLSFESIPNPQVADNFAARGSFSATATAPAPAVKRADDEPM